MEYNHEKAVADGVNVGCDIYRINTAITQGGTKVDAGFLVDKHDRQTRKVRREQLDEVPVLRPIPSHPGGRDRFGRLRF